MLNSPRLGVLALVLASCDARPANSDFEQPAVPESVPECAPLATSEFLVLGRGSDLTQLRASFHRGPVVLHLTHCQMRVVRDCELVHSAFAWEFAPVDMRPDEIGEGVQASWWMGEGEAVDRVRLHVAGRYELAQAENLQLRGDGCHEVTHYSVAVESGAYELVNDEGRTVEHEGILECCSHHDRAGCDVPLRVELAPTEGLSEVPGAVERSAVEGPSSVRQPVEIAGAAEQSSFSLDRLEVSQAAHLACIRAGGCRPRDEHDSPLPASLDACEAEAYCAWAGGRLPSKSEWLWAAQGGEHDRRYPWGDAPPNPRLVAWNPGARNYGLVGPLPVGSLPAGASRDGLLDMAGNVSEWVRSEAGHVGLGGDWDTDIFDYLNVNGVEAAGARCAYPRTTSTLSK